MSGKRDKQLRKQYRKDVEEYLKNGGLFELFELIVKPKPRWVPRWLWLFGTGIFINIQEEGDDAGTKTADKG